MFRVLIGYGVVTFALLQVIEPIMHALRLPDATLTYAVLALALGFPVAVVLGWAFDINEGRIERTPGGKGARMGLVLVGVGLLAAAPGLVWYFGFQRPRATTPATATPSIAVLAFADLSPAKDQEYFSDGIAEEILNALTRVKGLRVAGRTSSFSFKDKGQDLRAIGETLGVATILEGSVRKQGNKVRITAQLIQVSDGFHLWSKAFDGDLTDVFGLQESVARAITSELKVVLQGDPQAPLVPVATANPEAYALFLQATAAFNARDYVRMRDAIGWLGQALQLDPGFARGHARLAMIHAVGTAPFGASPVEGERHARRAIELDPSLAEPWVALGLLAGRHRQWAQERTAFERALELEPDDSLVNVHFAQALITAGYAKQGTARLDRALAIDPVLPIALLWRAAQRLFDGETDAAQRQLERARSVGMQFADVWLAEVARARGDRTRARAMAGTLPVVVWNSCLPNPAESLPVLEDAFYLGGDAADKRAEAVIAACLAGRPAQISPWIVFAAMEMGPPARVLSLLALPTDSDPGVLESFWGTFGRPARRDPGFSEFARRFGWADLWERYGPPDGCRRVAARDYACD